VAVHQKLTGLLLVNTTEPGVHPAGISQRNRRYLERLHRERSVAFDVATAARIWGLDHASAARLLGYLARRGWLSRVRRGLYVAVPLDARRSGEWTEDPWIVADRVFSPCYIGGWSACEHWDLTDQVFRTMARRHCAQGS
jgi:predicted transcriptional regulator of viral defense system